MDLGDPNRSFSSFQFSGAELLTVSHGISAVGNGNSRSLLEAGWLDNAITVTPGGGTASGTMRRTMLYHLIGRGVNPVFLTVQLQDNLA